MLISLWSSFSPLTDISTISLLRGRNHSWYWGYDAQVQLYLLYTISLSSDSLGFWLFGALPGLVVKYSNLLKEKKNALTLITMQDRSGYVIWQSWFQRLKWYNLDPFPLHLSILSVPALVVRRTILCSKPI